MARKIRKNSVRLKVATIAAAAVAVTGGVVLPATTAMADPTTDETSPAHQNLIKYHEPTSYAAIPEFWSCPTWPRPCLI
ncbi:hypothetical protein [Streptomyces sp. NPDC059538]|uniref:hypothetical protein n=1 Tax=Streptomyces sp. NPDC059538 TaxID=3346860 RepID=UPI00367A9932